jgi:ribosome modulation factor
MENKNSSPYYQGYEAYYTGVDEKNCPYDENTSLYSFWHQGYQAAKNSDIC